MKSLFAVLAFAVFTHSAMAADPQPLYKKVFNDTADEKIESYVIQTYKEVVQSSRDNPIKKKIAAINQDYGSNNAVRMVEKTDLFKLGQGRGGAGKYGADYLIGIPLSPQGHGMIESYGAYIHAYAYLDMGNGTITVSLENFSDVVDLK